jgi:DNA-binding winged helix-turn-helix (wHTH) protein
MSDRYLSLTTASEIMDVGSKKHWVISFGPFLAIRAYRILERDGAPVQIGSRAFDILVHLLEHPGEVVGRHALLGAAWPDTNIEEGNLRFQMMMLRRALGSGKTYIVNVPGRGYCFTAPLAYLRHRCEADGAYARGKVPPRVR